MCTLIVNLLLHQSLPVSFRICINLVRSTQSYAFCQPMKQTHSSSVFLCYDIILSIPITSIFPLHLLNPNLSSPRTSSIFLSIFYLSILVTVFAVCVMEKIVQWLIHFLGSGFFVKAVIVTSVRSLDHFPVSCWLLISCIIILRPSSPNNLSPSTDIPSFPEAFYFLITLMAFSTLLCKIVI
jgi:hypothetical protein